MRCMGPNMMPSNPPRRFTDEVLSDEMAAILRAKSPSERLRIAFGMYRSARRLIELNARRANPEWFEVELCRHVARRMSHGS